jgi:hypothetical protein
MDGQTVYYFDNNAATRAAPEVVGAMPPFLRDLQAAIAENGMHPCIPMHREIKPKTPQSILKQANITVDEPLDNL